MPKTAYVAANATIVGRVRLGENASIWHGAVLRGDNGSIQIGANSNIQDNTVIHVSPEAAVIIGDNVTVGHAAILHGCTVGDGALIGMGAILLDGCVVEAGAMVGAGALVTGGTVIPAGMLAVGSPAKVLRPLREAEIAYMQKDIQQYLRLSAQLPAVELSYE